MSLTREVIKLLKRTFKTGPGVPAFHLETAYRGVTKPPEEITLGEREGVTLPPETRMTRETIKKHQQSGKRVGESVTTDVDIAKGYAGPEGTVMILKGLKSVVAVPGGDKGEHLARQINPENVEGFLNPKTGKVLPFAAYQYKGSKPKASQLDTDQSNGLCNESDVTPKNDSLSKDQFAQEIVKILKLK